MRLKTEKKIILQLHYILVKLKTHFKIIFSTLGKVDFKPPDITLYILKGHIIEIIEVKIIHRPLDIKIII